MNVRPLIAALLLIVGLQVPTAAAQGGEGAPPGGGAAGAAAPSELNAIVMTIDGRVRTRTDAGPWHDVKVNDLLRSGSEIQTGLNSRAALRAGRNATILIDPCTTVVIPEVVQDGQVLRTSAVLKSGRVDVKVDKVGLTNDFKVVTPTTTIAVKGTSLAVMSGALAGTEVTGARTNLINSIEAIWVQANLAFLFGDGSSDDFLKDPAEHALNDSVKRNLPPGLIADLQQLHQAWVNGDLQNVQFNIADLQLIMNQQLGGAAAQSDEVAKAIAAEELALIRAAILKEAATADEAVVMAQFYAQQAVAFSAIAANMLPGAVAIVDSQTGPAKEAADGAHGSMLSALKNADSAGSFRDDAVNDYNLTVKAVQQGDTKAAQGFALAAAKAASNSASYAEQAGSDSEQAMKAAQTAVSAALIAKQAIDQYFGVVQQVESMAAAAGAEAAIAKNSAQAIETLRGLAQQIQNQMPSAQGASVISLGTAKLAGAMTAAMQAAAFRDQALAAATSARSAGEKALFNSAALYASQALLDASTAAQAATNAANAAAEAKVAAQAALKLAFPGGGK